MTDHKKPAEMKDEDLDSVQGGAGYLKLGDIDGESVNSFDLTMKRGVAGGRASAAPVEDFKLNYEKIKWEY